MQVARPARKKAANIDRFVVNTGEADVSAPSEVHFEIIAQLEMAEVLFDADPAGRRAGAPSAGEDAPGSVLALAARAGP
jgi:hypothetical protein